MDIIFDVYVDICIKSSERERRGKVDGIETVIKTVDQSLPVEIDRFWVLPHNKMALQQNFIVWALETAKIENYEKELYLGGCHEENSDMCVSYINGSVQRERLLECTHDEADDRLLFHMNHAVKVEFFRSVVIASEDTDVFLSATHHFPELKCHELWFLSGI